MVQIIPSILATTEGEYAQLIKAVNNDEALVDSWVHIDMMDGVDVNNVSVSAVVIKKFPVNLELEGHLMVVKPTDWVRQLSGFGFKRFITPIEISQSELDQFIEMCKLNNHQVGLSLNPETPVENIREWLDKIDEVLIMSIHPGFGGQEFIPESIEKVKKLRSMAPRMLIGVDGGVTIELVKPLVDAGASNLVVGAKRLIEEGIDETLEKIWETIQPSG